MSWLRKLTEPGKLYTMDMSEHWVALGKLDRMLCGYISTVVNELIDPKAIEKKKPTLRRRKIQAERNRDPGARLPRKDPLAEYSDGDNASMTLWLEHNLTIAMYTAVLEGDWDSFATVEIFNLASALDDYPPGCASRWTPWTAIERQSAKTLLTCRAHIGETTWLSLDRAWSRFNQMTDTVLIDDAIMEAHDLLLVQREVMLAAGRTDLLPRPEGCLATPTFSTALASPPAESKTYVKRLRECFNVNPRMRYASKNAINREVKGNEGRINKALDWMELHGEYKPRKKSGRN